MMSKIIKSPFTDEQVQKLNEYQNLGIVHEFTCGNDHNGERKLIAKNDGWICPTCDYKQDWCYSFMFDIKGIKDNWNKSLFSKMKPV
jgi:hypothetical protein